MKNIKDLAASTAQNWGTIAGEIDNNFRGTSDDIRNDVTYVRGLDASNNPIKISKADLASVVGSLIPEATKSAKGLMSAYLYMHSAQAIINIQSKAGYVKICSMQYSSGGEGVSTSASFLVSGGNDYSNISQVSFVSLVLHRGSVQGVYNQTLGAGLSFGYTVTSSEVALYAKISSYNVPLTAIPLYLGNQVSMTYNEFTETEPSGWTPILES